MIKRKRRRKTTASIIKRTQQFDVCSSAGVVVAAKTTVASCQAKVFCEICKDQRKLLIAQHGQFVVFCVARTWIFEETGPPQQRLAENANRKAHGVQRIGRGKMVHRMRNSCELRCVAASGQTLSFFEQMVAAVAPRPCCRWGPALARKY